MSKRLFSFILFAVLCLAASAQWNFDGTKKYYLTCSSRAGYIALGDYHGSGYPIFYVTSDVVASDGYWYINGDDEKGYTFRNATTNQYLSWNNDYTIYRYLSPSNQLTAACYWNISYDETHQCVAISTVSKYKGSNDKTTTNYYFNLRSTNQFGTYNTYSGTNGQIHIIDEDGNEVTPDGGNVKDKYTLTFHSIDADNNVEFDTYSYTFTDYYWLEDFKSYQDYDYAYASVELPYVAYGSENIYVYYTKHELNLKTTQIVNGQFAEGTTWYRVYIGGGRVLHVDNNQIFCDTYETSYDPAYFWCFTKTKDGYYQVYNYLTGPTKVLTAASSENSTLLLMSDKAGYNEFDITFNSSGFNLQLPGVFPYTCCNNYGGGGVLKLWQSYASTSDLGSRFDFEEFGDVNFVPIEEIFIDNVGVDGITLTERDVFWAQYHYTPEDATMTSVTWSTDNKNVASVDAYGQVTAEGEGTAHITVALQSDPTVSASFRVNVIGLVRVSSITVPSSLSLFVGKSARINYNVAPEDAYDASVSFRSSNTDVVLVDGDGYLTALSEGTAIITISANDDSGVYAQCVVTVTDASKGTVVTHGEDYVYLTSTGNAVLALPKDYLRGEYSYDETGLFTAPLVDGKIFQRSGILSVGEELPVELPTFTSYKFNNKFNYQIFSDVEVADPTGTEINIPIGAIGKRLTASFQLPDKDVVVWVDGKRQISKESRLRFDRPITYTIGRDGWIELQLKQMVDGSYTDELIPFGHHTTVTVDWLTDHSYSNYGVPEVYIMTEDGQGITSRTEYKNATIEIEGGGAFPDFAEMAVLVKGRGNTSWGSIGSKNPYRLKFESKQKPLGLSKSKSWVLLANKQSGSMTTNALGQKVASLMASDGACHVIPVELYINGKYQGSYNFTEKVGFSKSSIELADESYAAMMELDTYTETGNIPPITYGNAYGMAAKIHEPDIYDVDEFGDPLYTGELTVDGILADFNRMTEAVSMGNYDRYVDIPSLVSYLAASELTSHCELKHSKSVFCYSENVNDGFNLEGYDETPWKFGPLWDCDWSFGYEQNSTYFTYNVEADFFNHLLSNGANWRFWRDLRYNNTLVDQDYYYRWNKFMMQGGLEELLEFCDDYYSFAARSLGHNNAGVGRDYNDYATITARSKSWLKQRANYVYSTLKTYPLEESPYLEGRTFEPGDTNGDGNLSMTDVSRLMRIVLGLAVDIYGAADVNGDGNVNRDDIEALARKILNK